MGGGGVAFQGFVADFFSAVMIALCLAVPGAMFYMGAMLARVAEQITGVRRELCAIREDFDSHILDHREWAGEERRDHERRHSAPALQRGIQ